MVCFADSRFLVILTTRNLQEIRKYQTEHNEMSPLNKKGVQWLEGLHLNPMVQEAKLSSILVCFAGGRWAVTAIFQTSALVPATYSKTESCHQGKASGKGEVKKDWELKGILSVSSS